MDDSAGVTVTDSIDELVHEEFNLIVCDCVLVFSHVLFQIIVQILEDQMQFLLTWHV